MEGDTPQVPVTQEAQPETKGVPQTPPEPTVPTKPKKRLKLKILIILVVALVGLGVGGFFVYKNIFGPEVKKVPVKIYNQNISGEIKQDQIWSGTIHVTGDIEVKEGVTLTILPGTIVEVTAFSDDQHGGIDHPHDPNFPKDPDRVETQSTKISVWGALNAIGTPDNRIIFTSKSETPTTYDWDGLHISHGRLEYAIVEYARYNNFQESSDVIVANNIIRNILECCICIGHSKPISPQILNNDIYNCGHEGIDNAGGSPLIRGNYFHRENPEIQPDPSIGGVGIVIYKNAYPIVEDNVFEKNSNAIIFIGASMHEEEQGKEVIIRNNTIKNNDVGINIDPDYPFDAVIMENNQLINNKEAERVEPEQVLNGTADWKTYTNTKYNYQSKVPLDFTNKAKPAGWVATSEDDSIDFSRERQWYVMIQSLPDAPFYNPPLGTELVGWLKQNKVLFDDYQTLDKPNFEIGGIPAVKMYSPGRPQAFNADIIYFIKDNKLFQIQALADTDDENGVDVENVKEICNQILSSFKFIK